MVSLFHEHALCAKGRQRHANTVKRQAGRSRSGRPTGRAPLGSTPSLQPSTIRYLTWPLHTRSIAPQVTRSSETGMAPTSYSESTKWKSAANPRRGHGRGAAHPHGLLHRPHQDLPQLPVFVGELQPTGCLMCLRACFHASGGILSLQKGILARRTQSPAVSACLSPLCRSKKGRMMRSRRALRASQGVPGASASRTRP